ncbi:MAG: phenylacetate--CoA ligase family protein [Burkholderiales bacterium]
MAEQASRLRLPDLLPGSTPGILWPPIPSTRHAAILALLFQMESSQWLPEAALRARQSMQLRELLAHARRHCRFYRDRLPTDVAAWDAIPLLTRHDLQSHFDALLADTYPLAHGKTFDITTGGSTGEPVMVRRTQLTQLFWEASTLRDHLWHRRDFSGTMAIIRHFDRPVDSSRPGRWGSGIFPSGPTWHLPVSTDVERQLRWLQSVTPDILLTYPPNLMALMARMGREGMVLSRLREVRMISGTVTPALRQECRNTLNVPLTDLYSAQEVGVIGLQCPESGLVHLQSENLLVEVLNARGEACQEDEVGRVVVTDLHNFAMPLIRYALRDWAERGPTCPCGRGLPTLRRVLGRTRNMAFSPDGKQFWPVLGLHRFRQAIPDLRQYQLLQTENDAITVNLVCRPPPSAQQLQMLQEVLEEAMGYAYRWTWRIQDTELPLTASGKFEEFMSLLSDSEQRT